MIGRKKPVRIPEQGSVAPDGSTWTVMTGIDVTEYRLGSGIATSPEGTQERTVALMFLSDDDEFTFGFSPQTARRLALDLTRIAEQADRA